MIHLSKQISRDDLLVIVQHELNTIGLLLVRLGGKSEVGPILKGEVEEALKGLVKINDYVGKIAARPRFFERVKDTIETVVSIFDLFRRKRWDWVFVPPSKKAARNSRAACPSNEVTLGSRHALSCGQWIAGRSRWLLSAGL